MKNIIIILICFAFMAFGRLEKETLTLTPAETDYIFNSNINSRNLIMKGSFPGVTTEQTLALINQLDSVQRLLIKQIAPQRNKK